MPTVKFGMSTKPINSTSRVFYGGSVYEANCKLKEPCSEQAPVFIVQGLTKGNFYNFAQWGDRYYWIDDIVYKTHHIQEVSCHLDPLATFRDYIKNNKYYVVYGDSSHWNQWVDDMRVHPEKEATFSEGTYFDMFHDTDSGKTLHINDTFDGTVIIRVLESGNQDIIDQVKAKHPNFPNFNPVEHQGVNTYAIPFQYFGKWLCDMADTLGICVESPFQTGSTTTGWGLELVQALAKVWSGVCGAGSWRDNVLSVTYMPIPISDYDSYLGSSKFVPMMGFLMGAIPAFVNNPNGQTVIRLFTSPVEMWVGLNQEVNLPWHAITAKPGSSVINAGANNQYSFLRNNRWADFQLITPNGCIDFDTNILRNNDKVGIWTSLDLMTGNWVMKVSEQHLGYGETLGTVSGCIGINLMDFIGTGNGTGETANQVSNQVIAAVVQAYTGVPVGQAVSQYKSNTTRVTPTIGENGEVIGNTIETREGDGETKSDIISSGISFNVPTTGVTKAVTTGGAGGGIAGLYLMTQRVRASNYKFGQCTIVPIQYVMEDFAGYVDMCNKDGYPVRKTLNLLNDNVTGYIQCSGAYVDYCPGATQANMSTINSYLNGGIYIEE